MNNFAARVRYLMELRGFSQHELARRAGTTQANISFILKEQRVPRVDLAARMALALDTELDWLCDLPRREADDLNVEERLMLEAFRMLNRPALRQAGIEAIRAMAR